MKSKDHWENIYTTKQSTGVSWYKPHLDLSLQLISKLALNPKSSMIDIGGGASTLTDDLLAKNFQNITVLDISSAALQISKKRLGDKADKVTWMEADITRVGIPKDRYDLWHDRAVFHFLTDPPDRKEYIKILNASLKTNGHVIMASFNLNGPLKCSGLDIVRYSPESLSKELGAQMKLVESLDETHKTPFDTLQNFTYCLFKKL